jgi:hypothetical protein
MYSRASILIATCLALTLFAPVGEAADEVPLVVAVDTSRSLTPADVAAVREAVATHLTGLPGTVPIGLVTFNDQARWQVPVGAELDAVVRALEALDPAGSYTVLHDAMFVAARGLPEGGVVLVVSDGRDENSATTVDDVARLCEGNRVRIVTAAFGQRVDERALRRLALVTRGEYVGRLQQVEPGSLVAVVEDVRAAVAAEVEAAAVPAPAAAAGQAQPPPAVETTAREPAGLPRWLIPVAALVLLAAVGVGWLLVRRPRVVEERVCATCGAALEAWEASCSSCEIKELEEAASTQPVARSAVQDESILDPEVFRKAPLPEGLDNTVVLDEQPVLVARQRGRSTRSYALPKDQVFVVGRAPGVNTLQVDEPTVSAQHFKVVPKGDEYYVVDLDTTNGTKVNHERVKVRKLVPGDVIRVGALEFEFAMRIRKVS